VIYLAIASPRPELAPVMSTTCPSRLELLVVNLSLRFTRASMALPAMVMGRKARQAA